MAGRPKRRARLERERLEREARIARGEPPDAPPWDHGREEETQPPSLEDFWRQMEQDLEQAAMQRGQQGERSGALLESQARMCGAWGMPIDVAARFLGVHEEEFSAQCMEAYELGATVVITKIAANMERIAIHGDDRHAAKVGMDILARRGGDLWKPPAQKIEVSRPPPKARVIPSRDLLPEERAQMRQILLAAEARKRQGLAAAALEHEGGEDE